MDVDHAGAPILMIRTGDAPVAIGTLTILIIIEDIVGLTATGILTAIVIGDITTETCDDIEPGVGTAANTRRRSCTALHADRLKRCHQDCDAAQLRSYL
jgi:hypothetical protein